MSTHDDYFAEVHWTEEPCDPDDPTSALVLSGAAWVTIRETENAPAYEFFTFPVGGAPEDFDARLDAGLAAEGWRRTSPLRSDWVRVRGAHNALGKCYVAPSDKEARAS